MPINLKEAVGAYRGIGLQDNDKTSDDAMA